MLTAPSGIVSAAEETEGPQSPYAPLPVFDALTIDGWRRVDAAINRGLTWMARQQQADGSFPTMVGGQPAITSFVTMAFLSRGHRPGVGPYGKHLDRAIDYALKSQRPDGLFLVDSTNFPPQQWGRGAHTAIYNHAITGMMLCEAYGMTDNAREEKIQEAINKALAFSRTMQRRPNNHSLDNFGWRYYKQLNMANKGEADLSVTGWCVMFYRSARNAEFDVPETFLTEAMQFVRNCFDEKSGGFAYAPYPEDYVVGRGMTGAGLLCFTLSGQRDEKIARAAGKWILDHPFTQYNQETSRKDRFMYGAYYCSQAMFVLGGEYWRKFYPTLAETLINGQKPTGSWPVGRDEAFGEIYPTALAVLSLTPPYQLLPIYQR